LKTSKNFFIAFVLVLLFSGFTISSNLYADGAPFPPDIFISNATLNGIPFTFGCGLYAVIPVNSHLEFDVLINVYDEHATISNTFSPLSPPGSPTFTPPLPTNVIQGSFLYHFSWISPTQYSGFLNLVVTDRIFKPVSCILNFEMALPVELSSFVSMLQDNDVVLNWSTSSEINNLGFELERANVFGQTSNEWIKISFVQGNGTTTSPNNYEFTDRNLTTGKYKYRLKQIDFNGNFEYFNLSNEVNIGIPDKFELSQNYPNPFNPTTKISYNLPFDGKVSLKIFDVSGKEVMSLTNEIKTAGYYETTVNGSNISSGVYFYSLIVDGRQMGVKRMTLLK